MSSMPRYVLRQCYPSWRHHSWEVVKSDTNGEPTRLKCVHCDQTVTGCNQIGTRLERDGLHEKEDHEPTKG